MFRVPSRFLAALAAVGGEVDGFLRQLRRVLHDAGLHAQLGQLAISV